LNFFFLIILMPLLVHAKVNRVQEEGLRFERFPLKKVCEYFGVKEALIPTKSSEKTIDCMGKDFEIEKLCLDKYKLVKNYTRARFDVTGELVDCHFASVVMVEITCREAHLSLCKDPDLSCKTIKKNFAYNHQFVRSSLLEEKIETLKCYFESSDKIQL